MGWYYTNGASRADIIDELTKTQFNTGSEWAIKTLRHCTRGNVLYAVHRVRGATDGIWREPSIGVYLLQKSAEGWGYKPMDEDCHPYYYHCPTSYFALSPCRTENSAVWRNMTIQAAKAKRERRRNAKKQADDFIRDHLQVIHVTR